jgi:YD repeat-containing protein
MTSKTVGGVTTNYTYDLAGQLASESRPGYSCSYTYDANGNRLTKTLNGVTETYTYDDDEPLAWAGLSRSSPGGTGNRAQNILTLSPSQVTSEPTWSCQGLVQKMHPPQTPNEQVDKHPETSPRR